MSTISLGISSTTNVVTLVLDPQNTLSISTAGSVTPTSILGLTDVNASSITDSQILVYDASTQTFIPGSNGASSDTNIGNTDQTLAGVRDVEMAGNNLTFSQGDTVRHTISPTLGATFFRGLTVDGDNADGGKLSLKEAPANGTSRFSLSAPASLASNVEFILPSADGSSGQFLKTDGSGNLSFDTPTDTDTNTNIGNADQTLAAARDVELGGNSLTFSNSDTVVHTISPTTGVTFHRGVNVTGTAASGATITLREDTDNGTDGVVLKAPAALGSSLTLTLPSADGSDGHFLKTDGAGNLSFAADNNDNTQLTDEQVQDIVGAMFSSNTETRISATYQDADGTIDLVVDDMNSTARSLTVACSDETTALTTGADKATFRMPQAATITAVRASVTTAPAGSVLTVDINKAGGSTSLLSTKLTIDAGEKTSTTAATAAVLDAAQDDITDDEEMTIDIDTIGSSTAGAGLKVTIYYTPT